MASFPSIGCYVRLALPTDDAEVQRQGIAHWLREQAIAPAMTQWFEDVNQPAATAYPAYEALHEALFTGQL